MWLDCELVVKNYKPLHLEEGMLFIQKLHQGTLKESIELFILERVPQDEEAFIAQNGYPVELYVVDDEGNIIAHNDEIGLWDDGDDDLFEISVDHVNNIFNEFEGMIQIDMTDISEEDSEYEEYVPTIIEGSVILRYPQEDYEEEEEEYEEDEYEEEEEPMCNMCNGTGESMHAPPGEGICSFCGGSGVDASYNS